MQSLKYFLKSYNAEFFLTSIQKLFIVFVRHLEWACGLHTLWAYNFGEYRWSSFKPVVFCQYGRRWQLFVLWWRWNMWEECQWIWRWRRNLCFSTNRLDHASVSLWFLCVRVFLSKFALLSSARVCDVVVLLYGLTAKLSPYNTWPFDLMFCFFFNSTIDKLGPVGRWLRHRLLSSILIGTPPLVALQVKFYLFAGCRIPSGFLLSWLRQMFYEHFFPLFELIQLSFAVFMGYGINAIYFLSAV